MIARRRPVRGSSISNRGAIPEKAPLRDAGALLSSPSREGPAYGLLLPAADVRRGLAERPSDIGASLPRWDPTFTGTLDSGAPSAVPHIPQKRKLSALFSPHFGQITLVLPNNSSLSILPLYRFGPFFGRTAEVNLTTRTPFDCAQRRLRYTKKSLETLAFVVLRVLGGYWLPMPIMTLTRYSGSPQLQS